MRNWAVEQDRQNGFQSGDTIEQWQELPAIMVRRPRIAKTVTFWAWWQPFLLSMSFFYSFVFLLFFFASPKSYGREGHGLLGSLSTAGSLSSAPHVLESGRPSGFIKKRQIFTLQLNNIVLRAVLKIVSHSSYSKEMVGN